MFTCKFRVTENCENYESGCENSQILCRRQVREKNVKIVNVKKRNMVTKEEMSEIRERLRGMKALNNLQMGFEG